LNIRELQSKKHLTLASYSLRFDHTSQGDIPAINSSSFGIIDEFDVSLDASSELKFDASNSRI